MKIKEIQEKIQKVFDRLAVKGIIGKQKYWCCQTCGSSAINDYYNEFKGYTFYTEQDFADLKKSGYCYLSFSSFKGDKKGDLRTGKEIVKAFKKAKIKTDWNGQTDTRIKIDFN